MNYFSTCKTHDEAKMLYRQLALEHHPDKGGNTPVMQEINVQYAKYLNGSGCDFYDFTKDSEDEVFRDFEEFVKRNPKFTSIIIGGSIIISGLKILEIIIKRI